MSCVLTQLLWSSHIKASQSHEFHRLQSCTSKCTWIWAAGGFTRARAGRWSPRGRRAPRRPPAGSWWQPWLPRRCWGCWSPAPCRSYPCRCGSSPLQERAQLSSGGTGALGHCSQGLTVPPCTHNTAATPKLLPAAWAGEEACEPLASTTLALSKGIYRTGCQVPLWAHSAWLGLCVSAGKSRLLLKPTLLLQCLRVCKEWGGAGVTSLTQDRGVVGIWVPRIILDLSRQQPSWRNVWSATIQDLERQKQKLNAPFHAALKSLSVLYWIF